MCKARVQELQRLGALQGRTRPRLFLQSRTLENGLPGQNEGPDRWLREKGHWPMMCEHLEGHLGHLLLCRKRQDRERGWARRQAHVSLQPGGAGGLLYN